MGAVIPLDASLGLRRARRDDLNPHGRTHAAKLRQGHGPVACSSALGSRTFRLIPPRQTLAWR